MRYWKEMGIVVGIMVLGGLVFLLGGREEKAEAKPSKPTTTTTTIPNIDSVEDGPYQKELLEIAKNFDLEPYGDDWNFSTVLGEHGNTIRVKTGKGIISLYSSQYGNCEDSPADFMPLMTEPGDAIVWEDVGADLTVCPGEVFVVATADEIKDLMADAED